MSAVFSPSSAPESDVALVVGLGLAFVSEASAITGAVSS